MNNIPVKITVETVVAAPIERVWHAYTMPADIKCWNAASDDWHTTAASVDLRVGGVFSSRMEAKDGSMGFDFAGTYTDIVTHELIAYAFGGRSARVEFAEVPQGIRVRVAFDSEPTHSMEQQRTGWQAILNSFTRYVEGKMKGATMSETMIQSYLFFGGRCEEALDFYRTALGAQVEMVMRYSESPDPVPQGMLQEGFENKIMHAAFRVGAATVLASDGCDDKSRFSGFSLALSVPTEAEADRAFAALAEGGRIGMPLTRTFWSPRFGMLTDRFGVGWMVMVPAAA